VGVSVPADVHSISVARAFATAAVEPAVVTPERVRDVARAEVLGAQATPVATIEPAPVVTTEPTPEGTPAPTPTPAVATLPVLPDPPTAGIVIASWYGPGFYGNRTACGQTYTPEIVGVAHRSLRCGTLVVLEYRGRTLTVPVIDRTSLSAALTSARFRCGSGSECPPTVRLAARVLSGLASAGTRLAALLAI
jgi:hypothetical protein